MGWVVPGVWGGGMTVRTLVVPGVWGPGLVCRVCLRTHLGGCRQASVGSLGGQNLQLGGPEMVKM